MKLIDVKKVTTVAQVDRRLRGGQLDDVLDVLPGMVHELFGQVPAPATKAEPAKIVATTAAAPMPAPASDQPFAAGKDLLQRLVYYSDGAGHIIALEPSAASLLDMALFAGDSRGLYRQRVISGGRSGESQLSAVFWDPRVDGGSQRSFDVRDGTGRLFCGKHEIVFKPAGKAAAPLLDIRWQRRALALAVDSDAVYYYVDQDRDGEEASGARLFVGRKGHLSFVPVDDVVHADKTTMYVTGQGKLKLGSDGAGEWLNGSLVNKLTVLDVGSQGRVIYTSLGVYGPNQLGTPCDDWLVAGTAR
jgi:hypothetical protein